MDDFSNFGVIAGQASQASIAQQARIQIYESLQSPLLYAEWLMKFDAIEKIGNAGRNNEEPFIKYLRGKTGLQYELVDNNTIYVSILVANISLPGWVSEYLKRITKYGNAYGDSVYLKDCLEALDLPVSK